jgi:hypothetical protein
MGGMNLYSVKTCCLYATGSVLKGMDDLGNFLLGQFLGRIAIPRTARCLTPIYLYLEACFVS